LGSDPQTNSHWPSERAKQGQGLGAKQPLSESAEAQAGSAPV